MFLVEKGADCVFSVFSVKSEVCEGYLCGSNTFKLGCADTGGAKEALYVYLGSLQVEESFLALNLAAKMASSINLK